MRILARGWSDGFDGPGRRLVDYLKGCNLRRTWCGNPESIAAVPEMVFYSEKSAFAAESCPHGAVRDELLDRRVCARCEDHARTDRWRDPRGGQKPDSRSDPSVRSTDVHRHRCPPGQGGEPALDPGRASRWGHTGVSAKVH